MRSREGRGGCSQARHSGSLPWPKRGTHEKELRQRHQSYLFVSLNSEAGEMCAPCAIRDLARERGKGPLVIGKCDRELFVICRDAAGCNIG